MDLTISFPSQLSFVIVFTFRNNTEFPDGKYVQCRVLGSRKGNSIVEVSLRESRLEGDLDEDEPPEANGIVSAYVCETNCKGCFLRLARNIRGRVILKELSDSFLPDPISMFPMGRLVIGKVKQVNFRKNPVEAANGKKGNTTASSEITVDMDMRESSLLDQDKLRYEDIKEGSRYKGVVARVEKYGVFVRFDGSDVSGMAHVSECSDDFVKNLVDLYDPGDPVKALVLKVDKEQRRISLGLKASYFEGDADSDSEEEFDEDLSLEGEQGDSEKDGEESLMDAEDLDSDDENYMTKLAAKMEKSHGDESSSDDDDSNSTENDDSTDDRPLVEAARKREPRTMMSTDVGFVWDSSTDGRKASTGVSRMEEDTSDDDSAADSSDSDEDDEQGKAKGSHRSRQKAAQKRKEEKEIAMRESALADGTADKSPETATDFERLLASEPNASEHWIKFMAYHLSFADIDAARRVAQRAFDRIEFRQENEKLNVWTALLTLELKYGSPSSLNEAIENACKQNNPKQVYLRMCEILEREVDAARENAISHCDASDRANEMFGKMCKRFKSKKTVWLANAKYVLKTGNHEEANDLLKRSLLSIPDYKHIEMLSKFAQLEFEFGSPERGRTLFNALLTKNPKRLDLLFVFVDKEVKCHNIDGARALFRGVIHPSPGSTEMKLNDKQMKSLFKKWYRMEENHGDMNSQEQVKLEATAYVQRVTAAKRK